MSNKEEVYNEEIEEPLYQEDEETVQWTDVSIPEPGEEVVSDLDEETVINGDLPLDVPKELIHLGEKIKRNATNKRRQTRGEQQRSQTPC